MLNNKHLPKIDNKIKDSITIVFGFWIFYFLCYSLEGPLHSLISNYTALKSEYTVGEQLTKFYLFIILLISFYSYRVSNEPSEVKLSIAFISLSLILYLSESNMIAEKAQPIFAIIIVPYTAILLLRLRYYLSLLSFIGGFGFIFCGFTIDLLNQNKLINSFFPDFIAFYAHSPPMREERFDVVGVAFLCLSVILSYKFIMRNIINKHTNTILLILFTSGMLTIGNGFLHYQYDPYWRVYLVALAMTIIGYLGLIFILNVIFNYDNKTTFFSNDLFYLFIFFVFVVLPSIHGKTRILASLLLWFPSIYYAAYYLWRKHPVYGQTKATDKNSYFPH